MQIEVQEHEITPETHRNSLFSGKNWQYCNFRHLHWEVTLNTVKLQELCYEQNKHSKFFTVHHQHNILKKIIKGDITSCTFHKIQIYVKKYNKKCRQ